MIKKNLFLAIAVIFLLSGCARPVPQSIDGQPMTRLSSLDGARVFAASDDGRSLAYVNNGLYLLDLDSGDKQRLAEKAPAEIAWSRAGDKLAAAFTQSEYETRLIVYASDGQAEQEFLLPAAASKLFWSIRGDLLVTAYKLEVYSFGGNLKQYLYRLESTDVVEMVIADTTLMPATVKIVAPVLSMIHPVLFTSFGDEFFYARVYDPPKFPPYLKIFSMSWQVGTARALLKLPSLEIALKQGLHDDAAIVESNGKEYAIESWTQPLNVEASRYRFSAGQLYNGDLLINDWGQNSELQILPNGHYLLALKNSLYLGTGLKSQPGNEYNENAWTLRRWRAAGLITTAEYQKQLNKDLP